MIECGISLVRLLNLPSRSGQREKEATLSLGCSQLHQRPALENVALDVRANPPHRIGDESDLLARIELLHRLHQPDVAPLDQARNPQSEGAILRANFNYKAKAATTRPATPPHIPLP